MFANPCEERVYLLVQNKFEDKNFYSICILFCFRCSSLNEIDRSLFKYNFHCWPIETIKHFLMCKFKKKFNHFKTLHVQAYNFITDFLSPHEVEASPLAVYERRGKTFTGGENEFRRYQVERSQSLRSQQIFVVGFSYRYIVIKCRVESSKISGRKKSVASFSLEDTRQKVWKVLQIQKEVSHLSSNSFPWQVFDAVIL